MIVLLLLLPIPPGNYTVDVIKTVDIITVFDNVTTDMLTDVTTTAGITTTVATIIKYGST